MSRRRLLSFESRTQPLISRRAFFRRVARNALVATLLINVSLLAGMCGYHWTEQMEWIDAFVNAAMILSGMGPVSPLQTWGGKFFAGLYALYSGLAVIIAAGVLIAPAVHRVVHRFHMEEEKK